MKRFILILISLYLVSCSKWSSDKENFVNAYKEILIVRVSEPDSLKAIKAVDKIYQKYSYSKETFKKDYFRFASNHKEFLEMLDSARIRKDREMRDMQRNKYEKRAMEE